MFAWEITLERRPAVWLARACLFAALSVPLAPEVPSVTAELSDVTTALMAESAVCI